MSPRSDADPAAGPARTAAEIHAHLRQHVDHALRRPGMYGGEVALVPLFHLLAFAEGIDGDWEREREAWRRRDVLLPTGVSGAFGYVLPDGARDHCAVASVYAEFAHRVGWLPLDRRLARDEHDDLVSSVPTWVTEDRTSADVAARFGPPSALLGGSHPSFPETLLYASDADVPPTAFHLWNSPVDTPFPQPVLLAARIGGVLFDRALHFTPEGRARRPR
ncbi:hypothetical protein [Micromonospora sp. WMMD812]|uniref:hypothetical protein n=1 Tax=Micromonospora sp. WMMD812 TaxID=3015152 RepID=UPI00248C2E34|nr:hypothetical protein [Micromonospora sp. WMMD812]WBB68117.1 hypothetical protein O7603_01695 [Micromonospora sp. WMMD812]